jgi:hypothetical protein
MDIRDVLPRDAIPSIDEPAFGATYFGEPDDRVIVVEGRAYPVRVLSYHEIVNDLLDGRPIAVTWCPICASAVVYDRTVDDRVLTFGTSGSLADDALVMYDRETESQWKQPLGRAISGQFEGRSLDVVPAAMLSYGQFREAYPDGTVLQPVHGWDTAAGQSPSDAYDMTTYDRYDQSEAFGLYAMRGEGPERTWSRDDIDAKAVVLGVRNGGEAVGYPVERVRAAGGVVTDSVGGMDIVVVATDGTAHAFEDPGYEFEVREGTVRADGTDWDPATGRSTDGRRLRRVPTRRLYAFAWQDDHGRDSFYGPT